MTETNWHGFQKGDERVGKEFFALLRKGFWPTNVNEQNFESAPRTPIEVMFDAVLRLETVAG